MSFLNKYNKNNNYHYHNSKKIGGYVYVIGTIEQQGWEGMITKLDSNGSIVWEKSFFSEYSNFTFIDIIECDNGDLLLLGNNQVVNANADSLFLLRINTSGIIIWSKGVPFENPYNNASYFGHTAIVKIGVETYVLLIKEFETESSQYNYSIEKSTLMKLDGNGDIIVQKEIVNKEYNYHIRGIQTFGDKIIAYGYVHQTNIFVPQERFSLVIEFDFNLIPYKRFIVKETDQPISQGVINVLYTNQYIIFSGEHFFIKYLVQPNGSIILSDHKKISFPNVYGAVYVDYNKDYIYIEYIDKPIREITKLTHNLEVVFSKRFSTYTGGQKLITQVLDNEALLLQNSYNGYINDVSFLGITNLNLDCCFDQIIPDAIISNIDLIIDIETNFTIAQGDVLLSQTALSPSDFQSVKEIVCLPDPSDPCVKDEEFCKLQSDIVKIFENCNFVDPGTKKIDYASLANCSSKIFDLVVEFNSNYPEHQLVLNLVNQLNAIKWFTGVYNATTYPDAWEAIQFIIDYLSVLGNCNCENTIAITDFASIQSGNLYLQSAGSRGDDSTKGIHLRWALREALAEHLPKANYATTNHNFNKQDDFVKIYRAKYVPYQVTLDFNNAPLQINEGVRQKNWVYEVDGKVFHMHFRNLTKYSEVRAIIDPVSNSSEFIRNYGDALLEIENITELSFKISSKFEILDSDSHIKTELLSVPENKITSPKGASLRKTFDTAVLNVTPLLAENIRSIRFSSHNAYVLSLSFEFYSDFILNTQNAYKWKFLGKYALAKEANVAFQRLEPQVNCLHNWLRYNDEAFVNASNYRTKWNSNDLPIMERIATSVAKYIALSDAQDNPRAIEFFPFDNYDDAAACSVTNPDYDPYIPETPLETTGIEIPFLDVLLLGSMDYHVARMIGLGTLDLNPVVFEGDYMYLAEYVSEGDLQDGQGARKVQHLYCSLPTALSDERLPLPVDLKKPVPGAFFNNGYNNSEVEEEDDENIDHEQNNFTAVELTSDGYTPDGKARYYSLFAEPLLDEQSNAPFYYVENEFVACQTTDPVFAGLEYRKVQIGEESNWIKPELSHNPSFFNLDTSGVPQALTNETVELVLPDQGEPLYTHVVKESGEIEYSSYGINWFSRAAPSERVFPVKTTIIPTNQLLPPTNINATLIQKESPLFLTTSSEQLLYHQNPNPDADKTLVRLTFEYNHAQELIDYHQKINGEILPGYYEVHNEKELFAEKLQVFFRDRIPNSVSGKIKQTATLGNPLLVEVHTEPYSVSSSGINTDLDPQTVPPTYNETYVPIVIPGTEENYIGSILLVDGVEFIVHEVDATGNYPKFIVFKADASGSLLNLNSATDPTTEILVPETGSLFMLVENMQNPAMWGLPDSAGFTINIDLDNVHREEEIIIENMDCSTETHVQKFRGVYQKADIEKVFEKVDEDDDGAYDMLNGDFVKKHLGLYKVTFPGFNLEQHSEYKLDVVPGGNSVEWFNGIVRLHTMESAGRAPRKDFKVVRTENIGTDEPLILYIQDPTFPSEQDLYNYEGKLMDEATNLISQWTNYYPGYKVYLYKDDGLKLNQDTVLPQGEDSIRYTLFGMRSWDFPNEFEFDNEVNFFSKMSVPALMFANAIAEPVQPQKPTGGLYATRPDYFGKSSYTFHTKYGTPEIKSKPYSVQFNRASDIQFLSAIYDNTVLGYDANQQPIQNTVQYVMQNIFMNGEEDFYVDRWNDLLSFNHPTGYFSTFEGRTLPLPNNKEFIKGINDFVDAHNAYYHLTGSNAVGHLDEQDFNLNTEVIEAGDHHTALRVSHFLKDVLLNCFVPLTEIPILYNYVKGGDYKPVPKKQVIRDRNGNLLKPSHPDFDMAPMMKRIDPPSKQYESQFTDFGLDGASNARYFYAAREINNQLKTSDYSPILGPISLVNTAPPTAPEIIKIIPVLENRILGITPAIQLQINAYPTAQKIAKISIYRTNNPADSLSIRTMKLVKVVDLEIENLLADTKWIFEDDFSDLETVPFGDPLFYRISVSRIIKYNDREGQLIIDYAPSEASKMVLTNIVENYSPESPIVSYASEPITENGDLHFVNLFWDATVYKGNYHVYKMNAQGNWIAIARVLSDKINKGYYHVQQIDVQGNWSEVAIVSSVNETIYLPLELTNLNTYTLPTQSQEGTRIYHHFKVLAENTSGMFSTKENILSLYDASQWNSIGGIGEMIVEGTFIIR